MIHQEPKQEREKPFKSIGYKVHNEVTYRGADFLLNSAVAVGFSYFSARTHLGQNYFSKPITKGFEHLLKPVISNENTVKEGAKWGMMFVSIMAGGTAIIPLMMGLENKENKKAMIHKIDEIAYGKELVLNDPRFKEQAIRIDNEPDKDFKTGMNARFAVLAPLIAMTVWPTTNRPMEKHVYIPLGNITKKAMEKMGIVPKSLIEKGVTEIVEGKPKFVSDWDFIHRSIGFDAALTFLYSFLHEFAYKAFAGKKQRHADHFHGNGDEDNTYTTDDRYRELDAHKEQAEETSIDTSKNWQQRVASPASTIAHLSPASSHEAHIVDSREGYASEHSVA